MLDFAAPSPAPQEVANYTHGLFTMCEASGVAVGGLSKSGAAVWPLPSADAAAAWVEPAGDMGQWPVAGPIGIMRLLRSGATLFEVEASSEAVFAGDGLFLVSRARLVKPVVKLTDRGLHVFAADVAEDVLGFIDRKRLDAARGAIAVSRQYARGHLRKGDLLRAQDHVRKAWASATTELECLALGAACHAASWGTDHYDPAINASCATADVAALWATKRLRDVKAQHAAAQPSLWLNTVKDAYARLFRRLIEITRQEETGTA